MKKLIILALIAAFLLMPAMVFGDEGATEPVFSEIRSEAFALMDPDGKLLISKNEDTKMYPASTTKIMTALLPLTLLLYIQTTIYIGKKVSTATQMTAG